MKKFATLLPAALLLVPALGQSPPKITLRSVPTKPMPRIVHMAHKPLVLSKGRLLTPADKSQFIASARLVFSPPPSPGAKPMAQPPNSAPSTQTISVGQPTATGSFTMAGYNVGEWDPSDAGLLMNLPGPSNQSNLGFNVMVSPNNLYVLTFEVYSYCAAQFAITTSPDGTGPGAQPTETVSVGQGKNGFAYAFDSTAAGGEWIEVTANCPWEFQSAELTTTAM